MQKTMFRVIKDKENPYVMLNKEFLNDTNLSWQAKGMLSYLLSLPDDWKIYESEVTTHSRDGIKCTRSCIKELIENGYIERNRLQDEKGRFNGYEYCVYEVSTIMPKKENGFSENGKRHTTNNYVTNNNSTIYNNENGVSPVGEHSMRNQDITHAISIYMNDLYKQKTGHKHPLLKPEQYNRVYDTLNSAASEYCLDCGAITDMMCAFLNSNIKSDWNINHFSTEGILTNRMYEACV